MREDIERDLRLTSEEQRALNDLLRISLQDIPLQDQLQHALETVVSLSWLPVVPNGGIFLVDKHGGELALCVQQGLSPQIQNLCARVPFGRCLCGRAAATGEVQYAACMDERHEIQFPGIQPHGHYNLPIRGGQGRLLGVMVLYLRHGHQHNPREVQFLRSVATTLAAIIEHGRAQDALRQGAAVFENTTEGVLITDATTHIITVNPACEEITGYSRDELIDRTPDFLKSGRHDESFYRSMWANLNETGRWQGELWNRRKNGEVYPERLSINVVRDDEGRITHYVGVFSDITDRKQSQETLDRLTHHDVLTGLPNRLLLQARTDHALARARRSRGLVAIMFLDLDRFKGVNDTLGHPAGDQLLREVAQRLGQCVREEDTVCRLGGDEFTILLEDVSSTEEVSATAQRVLDVVSAGLVLEGQEVFITASIGISLFPDDSADTTTLFKHADSALNQSKEHGRSRFQFYTEDLTARALLRVALENDLRHALETGQFILHYQPQVDLLTGAIVGVEALVRWQHPERGLVPPGMFIPMAEESGLIVPLGEWVLRTACAQAGAWQAEGLPRISVAVNLSPGHFREKNLAETVYGVLRETALDPGCLELEITESLVMHDVDESIAILDKLKEMGTRLAIDDFGTGYSSLSYLKRFPVDKLKIDRSFVLDITTDPEDAAIAQAVISLSHSLKLKVVAEGVETLEQLSFLRSRSCDEMQGYYFSRPIPADQLADMLRQDKHIDWGTVDGLVAQRTVLLLDDDEHVLKSLSRALTKDGCRVLTTTDAQQAFALLAATEVGVVVADLRMPAMDGIEFLRRVRAIHPATVRIMLTGHANTATTMEAVNQCAVYKLAVKPWDNEELRALVRDAFRYRETLRAPPHRETDRYPEVS